MTKTEKNLRFWIGNVIGNSKLLFPINYKRPQFNDRIISDDTSICIEGFQRSGNSFFVALFKIANPKVKVAHHLHASIQITEAVKRKIPTVVLIRPPADAVASLITWDDNLSIPLALKTYADFYRKIKSLRSSFMLVEFQELITDADAVITKINKRFNTNYSLTNMSAKQIDETMKHSGEKSYQKNNSPYPNEYKKKRNAIHK